MKRFICKGFFKVLRVFRNEESSTSCHLDLRESNNGIEIPP